MRHVKCPECGHESSIARWAEVVMDKETEKIQRVSFFLPYSGDSFDMKKIKKAYPPKKFHVMSSEPDRFDKNKYSCGAYCIHCNAKL